MNTDTIAPAFEAGLTVLRDAGISGLPWWEAPDLAEEAMDAAGVEATDSVAFDALIAAHTDGTRERARRALKERLDVWASGDRELSAFYAGDLIEDAARAADLPAEDIVSIVGEVCPLPQSALFLAQQALRDFRRIPARMRDPLPERGAAEVHREFLAGHEKAIARGCTKFAPWYLAMVAESRTYCAERGGAQDAHNDCPAVAVGRAAPTFDIEHEPGLFGDVARWSQTYAFRPVREFAQPAALAVGAALFGRRWATPSGLGLNLYQVAIAETGGGKDALLGAPKALLAKTGLRHLIGPGDFTSDAAIETALRARPVQLMPLDEFGKLAQAMMGRNAPSFAKLAAKALLEIYPRSQPGSEWSGKQRADPARDNAAEPVHAPTLSILGVSTPEGFFEGMSQQTLDDGFLNRLTVIRTGAAGPRQRDPARLEPPAELVKRLQDAYGASAAGDIAEAKSRVATVAPKIRCARWADQSAIAALEEVEAWEDAAADEGRRGVCGRAAEQTQKIATIRALFRDPANPAVTEQDVQWAFDMVKRSIAAIEEGARAMMAGSEFEMLCNAIEAAVGKAGPMGLPNSYLLRAKGVSKHDDRMVESALKRLSQIGRIYVDVGPTSKTGKPSKRVRLMEFGGGIEEH